jgi:hypothetical protein
MHSENNKIFLAFRGVHLTSALWFLEKSKNISLNRMLIQSPLEGNNDYPIYS